MKSTLEKMTVKDIDKLAEKQNLLIEKGLVNLKTYYQAFNPSEPGKDKELECKIHVEVFESEMLRSSVCLNSIDEDEWECEIDEQNIDFEEKLELKLEMEAEKSDISAISESKSPIRAYNKMVKTPTIAKNIDGKSYKNPLSANKNLKFSGFTSKLASAKKIIVENPLVIKENGLKGFHITSQKIIQENPYIIQGDNKSQKSIIKSIVKEDKKQTVNNQIEAKIKEIEMLINGANVNFSDKTNIMGTLKNLKSQVQVAMKKPYAAPILRTPEKNIKSKHDISINTYKSARSAKVAYIQRNPLSSLNQNTTLNYSSKKVYKSFWKNNTEKKPTKPNNFDMSFLNKHNFSTDIISAFD